MKFSLRVVSTFVILICIPIAISQIWAQDVEDTTTQETGVAQEQDAEPEAPVDAEESDPEQDRFIPTEQVSQDLGVSFPVDI